MLVEKTMAVVTNAWIVEKHQLVVENPLWRTNQSDKNIKTQKPFCCDPDRKVFVNYDLRCKLNVVC